MLSARLGINIEALSPTRQIELMNELADGLLLSLEASERLEENAKEIAAKLDVLEPESMHNHEKAEYFKNRAITSMKNYAKEESQ